jgi:putative membrane protein
MGKNLRRWDTSPPRAAGNAVYARGRTNREPTHVNSHPNDEAPANDPRVFFAAERTLLAWIRTGVAPMGFGFIVARFGVFLRQIQLTRSESPLPFGISVWWGASLLLLGVVLNLAPIRHHIRVIRQLDEGSAEFRKPSSMAIGVAAALACVGLLVALSLVVVS